MNVVDRRSSPLTVCLCGDVMTGRGIDQVLQHPGDPTLREDFVKDARDYVRFAEQAHGPIPRRVASEYVWGDALAQLDEANPALRIVNLETAVTASGDAYPDKPVLYRMHPRNVGVLTAAKIDACVLANNHVLDWSRTGLAETLATLQSAGLRTAGAGCGKRAAEPVAIELAGGRRVLLVACATESSGVPHDWGARADRSGVRLLDDLSPATAAGVVGELAYARHPADAVIVSIHWGANWGHAIGADERAFAHALVDCGVDVVYGHSSHHAKAFEIYRERPILYGCGDFITDYEGIGGHEVFRGDLAIAWLVTLGERRLQRLTLLPFRVRRFRLERAPPADREWLLETLNRAGRAFGSVLTVEGATLVAMPGPARRS